MTFFNFVVGFVLFVLFVLFLYAFNFLVLIHWIHRLEKKVRELERRPIGVVKSLEQGLQGISIHGNIFGDEQEKR